MRYALMLSIMSVGAAIGGATWYFRAPVWGYLAAAIIFAGGLALWPRRAGGR